MFKKRLKVILNCRASFIRDVTEDMIAQGLFGCHRSEMEQKKEEEKDKGGVFGKENCREKCKCESKRSNAGCYRKCV